MFVRYSPFMDQIHIQCLFHLRYVLPCTLHALQFTADRIPDKWEPFAQS